MITIINTTPKVYSQKDFSQQVSLFNTQSLNIKHCVGCLNCWVKTPGLCTQKDDMPNIIESVMLSELVVFIGEIKVGLISSDLKRINEKLLPILMPYIGLFNGELHHQKRYEVYPDISLVLIDDDHMNDEVFEINKKIYERLSLNFHGNLRFAIKDDFSLGGLRHEINNY